MYDSLAARQKDYEAAYDYKLIRRTPLIIRVDGRGFSNVTRKLKKPYDPLMLEAMAETMFYVASEMSGAVFGYQQSDEITFVLKNDQSLDAEPWYGNSVQKLASITASLATKGLEKALAKQKEKLPLCGDALFDARVFALPTISEVVNNLIWRQQDCSNNAVSLASQVLLGKKIGKKTAMKLLHGKTLKNKIELLKEECLIDFDQEFPTSFKSGVGAYKIPLIIPSGTNKSTTRKRWIIDWDLPSFIEERDFIYNIITTGQDVFRETSLSEIDDLL